MTAATDAAAAFPIGAELAPCPFCGGPAGVMPNGGHGRYLGCLSLTCLIMPHKLLDLKGRPEQVEAMVMAWNKSERDQ